MASDSVTIQLPDGLYHRLERLAGLTKQPVEGIIVHTLLSTLPPLPEDLPPPSRDVLQAMETLSDVELRQLAAATFPEDQRASLADLRERRRVGTLPDREQGDLNRLLQAADLLVLQKAYASVLLRWREHPPVTPSNGAGARA